MFTADIQAVSDLDGAFKALNDGGLKGLSDWMTKIVGSNFPQFLKDLGFGVKGYNDNTSDLAQSTDDFTGAAEGSGRAIYDQKAAAEAASQALDDYKNKLNEVSQANQDAESFIQSYADSQKSYEKSHADAMANLQDAIKGGDKKEIADAQKGVQDLEATWHESTQKMIYDMVLAKVSVDGLTDAEFKATQELAVQMGIRTQAQADEANAMMDKANALADGIALQENVQNEKAATDEKLLQLEQAKADAAQQSTDAVVQGSAMGVNAANQLAASIENTTKKLVDMGNQASITASKVGAIGGTGVTGKTAAKAVGSQVHAHASGGDFMIPMSYGNEGFRLGNGDTASGGERVTITPRGESKSGATYNITINNPKKETTEESLRKSLQKLSFMGVPA
jgi:hypothetical protein